MAPVMTIGSGLLPEPLVLGVTHTLMAPPEGDCPKAGPPPKAMQPSSALPATVALMIRVTSPQSWLSGAARISPPPGIHWNLPQAAGIRLYGKFRIDATPPTHAAQRVFGVGNIPRMK